MLNIHYPKEIGDFHWVHRDSNAIDYNLKYEISDLIKIDYSVLVFKTKQGYILAIHKTDKEPAVIKLIEKLYPSEEECWNQAKEWMEKRTKSHILKKVLS